MKENRTTASEAAALCKQFEAHGMRVWIDGGWGVDALLGRQTRNHDDLDVIVEEKHVAGLRSLLESRGFHDAARPDTRPWNFVLENDAGAAVDVHVISLDAEGNGIYGPQENGDFYPAQALTEQGTIDGHPVRCVSAKYQIENRTGYTLRDSDRHDLLVLERLR